MSTAPRRSPSTSTVPSEGCEKAAARFRSVVFPAPFGPSSTQCSPRLDRPVDPMEQHRATLLGGDPTPHVHLRHPDRGHLTSRRAQDSGSLSRTFQSTVAVATTASAASVISTSTEKSTRPSASRRRERCGGRHPELRLRLDRPARHLQVGDLGAPRQRRHVAHPRREGTDESRSRRRLGDPEERPGVLAADVVVELRAVGQDRGSRRPPTSR